MAAATPGGGGGDSVCRGGDFGGELSDARGEVVSGERGRSTPAISDDDEPLPQVAHPVEEPLLPDAHPLELREARALAQAVISSPAKTSHQWGTSYGPIDLDDDIWEIRFNFPGQNNLERTLSKSDITVINMLALIEAHGYGIRDSMFYVKEHGRGPEGMELIDSMAKIVAMLDLYANDKILNITVLKKNATWPVGFNLEEVVPGIITEPVVFCVDKAGVNYISSDEEGLYPVGVDFTDVLHIGTQQSPNFQKKPFANCSTTVPVDAISVENPYKTMLFQTM